MQQNLDVASGDELCIWSINGDWRATAPNLAMRGSDAAEKLRIFVLPCMPCAQEGV